MAGRRIRRTRKGDYQLRLSAEERTLLRSLPAELRDILDSQDPALGRLYPPAYTSDPVHDAEYQMLMHGELRERHEEALAVMEETVENERLDQDQLHAWSRALNELRLVLGTRLDVTEDMDEVDPEDPRAPGFALYGYLTWLQGEIIEALAAAL
ncbi:MAG TPA: DUF2017 family protein [Acidimicrobiales bacterium]|nr:DUF2017 family protein [Acidimicrobiales bacterium]